MRILHRLNLLMKGRLTALLDRLEDPERSLNELVMEMEEELDAAKRAVARAMANEVRVRPAEWGRGPVRPGVLRSASVSGRTNRGRSRRVAG